MKTLIISALFLLGAAPIALAQGTSGPAPLPPDRKVMPAIEVVLPVPGSVMPAPEPDRTSMDEVQVNLPVPDLPGTGMPAPKPDRGAMGEVQVNLPVATLPGTAGNAPRVELWSVETTMAFAAGTVELRGRNLHLVRAVKVAGKEVPILFNNGSVMQIAPSLQNPGFASLELVRLGGKLDARIEFTPCMSAQWHGNRARIMLHPGADGWNVVQYSFRRLTLPNVEPGAYYASMLDMNGGNCGTYCSGVNPGEDALTFPWFRVPTWGGPSAIGPMNFQALCMVGGQLSYTNVVTLRPTL